MQLFITELHQFLTQKRNKKTANLIKDTCNNIILLRDDKCYIYTAAAAATTTATDF